MIVHMKMIFPLDLALTKLPQLNPLESNAFWGICSALFWKWMQRNCKKSVVCWKLFFLVMLKRSFLGISRIPSVQQLMFSFGNTTAMSVASMESLARNSYYIDIESVSQCCEVCER